MRIPKTTSNDPKKDKYYNGFQNTNTNADGRTTNIEFGGPSDSEKDFLTKFGNSLGRYRGDQKGTDIAITDDGISIEKVSLDISSEQQTISLENTFISSKVNNQDKNNSDKTLKESLEDAYTGIKNGMLKQVTGGYSVDDFKRAGEMAKDGGGFLGFMAGLSGANGEINNLSLSMSNLEEGKDEHFKEFHMNDWRDGDLLNNPANVAGTMQQDLRGTLGASNFTFDRDGSLNGDTSFGGVLKNIGNSVASSAVSALGLDGLANSIMNIADTDTTSDAEDAAQLIELNTATKDTIYTSKPGNYVKIRSLKMMGDDNNYNNMISYGHVVKPLEFVDKLREATFNRLKKDGKITSDDELWKASTFRKKLLNYGIDENNRASPYTQTATGNKQVYEKSNDFFTSSGISTLSDEEIRLITLIKNKNTYNKKLGYIYIKPFWKYSSSITDGSDDLQIPFEFNPEISEGPVQANYATETLINRLGQFHVYTGTNLSTLNIQLTYQALAPDTLSAEDNDALGKQYGSDAWMYYWTNNRIEEIELKLRSLVFPDMVNGSNNLIKPPIIEVHLENGMGENVETVGDLYKYPITYSSVGSNLSDKYLSVTRKLNGNSVQRYKKYIVNSVQIDKIDDASVEYPSYYGRMYNNEYKSYNPMYHIAQTTSEAGWSGYSRRRSFKATLQCTEVTENFIDLVPDFAAYYNSWVGKQSIANQMDTFVKNATGTNNFQSVKDILSGSLYTLTKGLASLEDQLVSYLEEARTIAKLYNKAGADQKSSIYKLNNNDGIYNNLSKEGSKNSKKITVDNNTTGSSLTIDKENLGMIFCNVNVPTSDKKLTDSGLTKENLTSSLSDYSIDDYTLDKLMQFDSEYDLNPEVEKLKKENLGLSKMFVYDSKASDNKLAIAVEDIDTYDSDGNSSIYKYLTPAIGTIYQLVTNINFIERKICELKNSNNSCYDFICTDEQGLKYNFKSQGSDSNISGTLYEAINKAANEIETKGSTNSDSLLNKMQEMKEKLGNIINSSDVQEILEFAKIMPNGKDLQITDTCYGWENSINMKLVHFEEGIKINRDSDDDYDIFNPMLALSKNKYFSSSIDEVKQRMEVSYKELTSLATFLTKLYNTKDFKEKGGANVPKAIEYIKKLTGKNVNKSASSSSDSESSEDSESTSESKGYCQDVADIISEMKGLEATAKSLDLCSEVISINSELLTNNEKFFKDLFNAYISAYQSCQKSCIANVLSLLTGIVNIYGISSSKKNIDVTYYNSDYKKITDTIQIEGKDLMVFVPNKLNIKPLSIKHILDNIIKLYGETLNFSQSVLNECKDVVTSGLSQNEVDKKKEKWDKGIANGADVRAVAGGLYQLIKSFSESTDNVPFKSLTFDAYIKGLKLINTDSIDENIKNTIMNAGSLELLKLVMPIKKEVNGEEKKSIAQPLDVECSDLIAELYGFYSKDGLQKQFTKLAGYYSENGSNNPGYIPTLHKLEEKSDIYSSPNSPTNLEAYDLYKDAYKEWIESDDFKNNKTYFKSESNGIIPYMFYKIGEQSEVAKTLKVAGSVSDIEVAKNLGAEV